MALTMLISADMEGATGAATPDDVIPGTTAWAEARKCWAQDVNTVVEALLSHGVSEVIVTDAHAHGASLDPSLLHPQATVIRGRPRRYGMMEGIDGGVHGVIFLGYHGTAGSSGVLSHAYMAAGIHELRLNGEPAGEGTINAHLADWFGAHILLVSGDDAACEEARHYAPAAQRVSTKQALTRFTARLRPPAAVHRDLAAATEIALRELPSKAPPTPRKGAELRTDIEFSSENCALAATAIPGVQATGPRSVCYASSDIPRWYRCLGAIWTMARSAQDGTYG